MPDSHTQKYGAENVSPSKPWIHVVKEGLMQALQRPRHHDREGLMRQVQYLPFINTLPMHSPASSYITSSHIKFLVWWFFFPLPVDAYFSRRCRDDKVVYDSPTLSVRPHSSLGGSSLALRNVFSYQFHSNIIERRTPEIFHLLGELAWSKTAGLLWDGLRGF